MAEIVIKYIYIGAFYRFWHDSIGNIGSPIRIVCTKRSFPTLEELVMVIKSILTGLGYKDIKEVVILSFEEISKDKVSCLFPTLNFDDGSLTTLTI